MNRRTITTTFLIFVICGFATSLLGGFWAFIKAMGIILAVIVASGILTYSIIWLEETYDILGECEDDEEE